MPLAIAQAIRFHLSINVSNLETSIAFFQALLGTPPAKARSDYAKFELNDPPLVLSLEPHVPAGRGALNHAGFRFPDSAALVEAQRRLEMAGFETRREEGVECCYARQTKFWVNDPDGGLWEFYVLDGDIEHRGAGQAKDAMLSHSNNCGPVCAQPENGKAIYEHRMGDSLLLACAEDGSLDEIRLRGTFNQSDHGRAIAGVLAEARRALKPGGKLHIHVLTADRPFSGALSLPGPASRVEHAPIDDELLGALEGSQFTNVTLTKFGPAPCFRANGAELRETMVAAHKPLSDVADEQRIVMYKGPFQQVTDDSQRLFRRGKRVTIPLAAWESLQQGPMGSQFVCFETRAGSRGSCGEG